MSAGALFGWFATVLPLSALLLVLSLVAVSRLGWQQQNYAGKSAAAGYGVFFPALAAAGAGLAVASRSGWAPEAIVLCAAAIGCGAFGLLDDLYGRPSPKGLAGHFRLLVKERRASTGQLKAIGCMAVALVVGSLVWGRFGLPAIASAALVALCANGVNLLDTRPGRALVGSLGAFACIGIAAAGRWAHAGTSIAAAAPFAVGCLLALPVARGQAAMLGDVGAYSLGAAIGAALALIIPLWAQVGLIGLLAALTLLADRYSLSAMLDRT